MKDHGFVERPLGAGAGSTIACMQCRRILVVTHSVYPFGSRARMGRGINCHLVGWSEAEAMSVRGKDKKKTFSLVSRNVYQI